MVVPTAARSTVLCQQFARRRTREPAALTAEMCLVVVPRLDRPPCQIDVSGILLVDRGLDTGDEALETQDAVQLLGSDADRGPAAASQLAFRDRQQRRQGSGSANGSGHETRDRLVHHRVQFTDGPREERLENRERGLWRGGFPENVRQADHVVPDIGSRDVLIDKLIGRHTDQTTQHPRTQPYPDDRASRWYVVIRRRGQRPEQPRQFAEDTPHLGATVRHVPLRHDPVADLLDPNG
ncbi:hypothetical protein GCM10010151_26740 [Actinoallomurus spadix]|uniref:Uncharacterized protein n=1 Tax=Actinoallomurus spadix TaxID=79912 RepID=A0ABP3G5R3_9ACTN